jgi:hypothetical protein
MDSERMTTEPFDLLGHGLQFSILRNNIANGHIGSSFRNSESDRLPDALSATGY